MINIKQFIMGNISIDFFKKKKDTAQIKKKKIGKTRLRLYVSFLRNTITDAAAKNRR
jgi:hypothetical protein